MAPKTAAVTAGPIVSSGPDQSSSSTPASLSHAPSQPALVATVSTIDPSPEPRDSDGDVLMSSSKHDDDVPGPSTTFIPPTAEPTLSSQTENISSSQQEMNRVPSPPLPDLSQPKTYDFDDEPDEVLHTLPIYLSPSLFPQLNMFQYPLMTRSLRVPSWAENRGKKITSRVKEVVGRVEVEVPVDAGVDVWRDDRARELGFVTDVREVNGDPDVEGGARDKRKKEKITEKKWGDKMRLRSDLVPSAPGASYFSGMIQDGALHLHPISRILQFRTSLTYLDDFDIKQNRRGGGGGGGDDDDDLSSSRPAGQSRTAASSSATASGARRDLNSRMLDDPNNDGSGSIKDFRNKMWATAQKEDEDKWVPYTWREGVEDEKVIKSLESMLVHPEKRNRLLCTSRGLDFLDHD